MKVIGGISIRSNLISSKIEFRNMVKVCNANKWHRVKHLEVNKTWGLQPRMASRRMLSAWAGRKLNIT